MIRAALDATSLFGIGRTGLADAGSSTTTSGVCGAVSSQLCGCDRLLLSVLLLCALLLIVCKYSYHRYWLTSIKIARVRPPTFPVKTALAITLISQSQAMFNRLRVDFVRLSDIKAGNVSPKNTIITIDYIK